MFSVGGYAFPSPSCSYQPNLTKPNRNARTYSYTKREKLPYQASRPLILQLKVNFNINRQRDETGHNE